MAATAAAESQRKHHANVFCFLRPLPRTKKSLVFESFNIVPMPAPAPRARVERGVSSLLASELLMAEMFQLLQHASASVELSFSLSLLLLLLPPSKGVLEFNIIQMTRLLASSAACPVTECLSRAEALLQTQDRQSIKIGRAHV